MIIRFKILALDFIRFFLNPNNPNYQEISPRRKLLDVGIYYLAIQLVMSAIVLWYPVEIAEYLGLYHKLEGKGFNGEIYIRILSAIVLAPIIEELVFRLPLGYHRDKSYFNWLYYGSSLIFGVIHISNYEYDSSHYPFIPFITMTQTFSGLMFAYIRMLYGFWYGVLLHSLFNLVAIICEYSFA